MFPYSCRSNQVSHWLWQRNRVCSCVLKRCGWTRAAVVIERAFTEGRGRWRWGSGGWEVKGQKDDAPVGSGRAWSVSARLASSTPHTHRPPERGVRGTHIYHWGRDVGRPGTGHSSPLHAHAHPRPHTHTHCKNTTLVLRTLQPRSVHVWREWRASQRINQTGFSLLDSTGADNDMRFT